MKNFDYTSLPTNIKCAISDYSCLNSLAEQCMEAMLTLFPEQEAPVRALMEAYGEWHHSREQTKREIIAFGFHEEDLFELMLAAHQARKAKQ